MRKLWVGVLGLMALAGISGAILFKPVIRPWYLRWGTTAAEQAMVLPGDEIIGGEGVIVSTRAITVQAPVEKVWPWLEQLGQNRGGMFSYEWLENLVGCQMKNLDHIDPALQDLRVGDKILMGPQKGLPYYQVVQIDEPRALVLVSVDSNTDQVGTGTWSFILLPQPGGSTRLLIRHRDAPSADQTTNTINAVFEPVAFVMEHRMLLTLRDYSEK